MSSSTSHTRLRLLATPLALTLTLGLAACGESSGASDPTSTGGGASSSAHDGHAGAADHAGHSGLQLTDGWVKASSSTMTGAFGTLQNHTDAPIVLVAVSSPAAGHGELHQTVKGADGPEMRQVNAMTIPAKGSRTLRPGADHLMLMGLKKPLTTGGQVRLTLKDKAGKSYPLTLPVRAFAGANESYSPGHH